MGSVENIYSCFEFSSTIALGNGPVKEEVLGYRRNFLGLLFAYSSFVRWLTYQLNLKRSYFGPGGVRSQA